MELPPELQDGFRREMHEFEEERHMPYVTSIERLANKEGCQEGARAELLGMIRTGLKDRLGPPGVRLMGKVQAIDELRRLRSLTRSLLRADSLQAFRDLLD